MTDANGTIPFTILVGDRDSATRWAKEVLEPEELVSFDLSDDTQGEELRQWLKLCASWRRVAVIYNADEAAQNRLLKPLEELTNAHVVLVCYSTTEILATIRGRGKLVLLTKSSEQHPIIQELLRYDDLRPMDKVDLYRGCGEWKILDLQAGIESMFAFVAGRRSELLIMMSRLLQRCQTGKEFCVRWLWGTS